MFCFIFNFFLLFSCILFFGNLIGFEYLLLNVYEGDVFYIVKLIYNFSIFVYNFFLIFRIFFLIEFLFFMEMIKGINKGKFVIVYKF